MELIVPRNKIKLFTEDKLVFQKYLLLGVRQEIKKINGTYIRGKVELNPRMLDKMLENKYHLTLKFND